MQKILDSVKNMLDKIIKTPYTSDADKKEIENMKKCPIPVTKCSACIQTVLKCSAFDTGFACIQTVLKCSAFETGFACLQTVLKHLLPAMLTIVVSFPMVRDNSSVFDMRKVAAAKQFGKKVTLYTVDSEKGFGTKTSRAVLWNTIEFECEYDAGRFLDEYANWLMGFGTGDSMRF